MFKHPIYFFFTAKLVKNNLSHASASWNLPASINFAENKMLDIQNISDGKCFNPFVLALFFPVSSIQHPNHVTKNIRYEYGLNLDGTASPASLKGIYRFEKQSHAISVNVYWYEDKKVSHPQITQNTKG